MKEIELQSMRHGKTTRMLSEYIQQIKNGKKSILFGKEYVVMDDKSYKEFIKQRAKDKQAVKKAILKHGCTDCSTQQQEVCDGNKMKCVVLILIKAIDEIYKEV